MTTNQTTKRAAELAEWAEALNQDELNLWVGANYALQFSAVQGIPPRFYLSTTERASLTPDRHEMIFGAEGAEYRLAASVRYASEQGITLHMDASRVVRS